MPEPKGHVMKYLMIMLIAGCAFAPTVECDDTTLGCHDEQFGSAEGVDGPGPSEPEGHGGIDAGDLGGDNGGFNGGIGGDRDGKGGWN